MILEFEYHRECEVASHCDTIVLAGLPLGHLLNHADSLAVEILVDTLGDCGLSDRTVFLDDELDYHTTLDIILLCRLRITDVLPSHFIRAA